MSDQNIYTQRMHRRLLLVSSVAIGTVGSVVFLLILKQALGGPLPSWIVGLLAVANFVGGMVIGETIWKVNGYVESRL